MKILIAKIKRWWHCFRHGFNGHTFNTSYFCTRMWIAKKAKFKVRIEKVTLIGCTCGKYWYKNYGYADDMK
jgi:hypothetical protein